MRPSEPVWRATPGSRLRLGFRFRGVGQGQDSAVVYRPLIPCRIIRAKQKSIIPVHRDQSAHINGFRA